MPYPNNAQVYICLHHPLQPIIYVKNPVMNSKMKPKAALKVKVFNVIEQRIQWINLQGKA